jgi:hypothetical protein
MAAAGPGTVDAPDPWADDLSADALEDLARAMGMGQSELAIDELANFQGFENFARALDGVSLEKVSREMLAVRLRRRGGGGEGRERGGGGGGRKVGAPATCF